jgi:hypothetical protein
VSLGHRHEATAISVTERVYVPTGEAFTAERRVGVRVTLQAREGVSTEYRVRHLERLGSPSRYAEFAQRVPQIARELDRDFLLVVDVTATGRPVYSLILGELVSALEGTEIRFKHAPVSVTGIAGGVSRSPDVGLLVPRRDLISASQILFDADQLKREGKDDDLVLAVACGVWAAERFLKKEDSVPAGSFGAA